MNCAVFAANLSHAKAMIRWLKLDDKIWHANTYGGKMRESYDRAILVRPVEGVTQEHFLWITLMLAPIITSTENITILHWRYEEFPKALTYHIASDDDGYYGC